MFVVALILIVLGLLSFGLSRWVRPPASEAPTGPQPHPDIPPDLRTAWEQGYNAAPSSGRTYAAQPSAGAQAAGALWGASVFFLGLGAAVMLVACVAIVGTKEVGIVTAFSRPVGAFDNGLHLKLPWEDVTEMDGAIQTDAHDQHGSDCVQARIAHQIVACVDVTVRWRIQEPAADELFRDYRDFGNVRSSLVTRQLATDINAVFQAYDPLAVDATGNSSAPSLNELSALVLSRMQDQVGSQVAVLSVFIPVLHFDAPTQSRINALQAQIAQTRIAQQAVATAEQQAKANQALAASVSTDPNVLVSKCLDVLNEMVNKSQAIPAGFSCWPGGGTGVVLPAPR